MTARRSLSITIGALLPFIALGASACGGEDGVIRVVDGDVMITRFVPAEAYSAFLAGTLAEADGRLDVAVARYRDALTIDDRDPLVWARFGEVLCRIAPSSSESDAAFQHAVAIDPTFATAHEAAAACEERRKNGSGARDQMLIASAEDPRRPALDAHANLILSEGMPDAARTRILAATRAFEDRPEAWESLLAWSLEHHDAFLARTSVTKLLAVRTSHVSSGARAAIALAGFGAIDEARATARATLLAKTDGRAIDSFVARLGIDDALVREDLDAARALSARGHVALGEVAARAYLLGKTSAARTLAREVSDADKADPDAAAVRVMLTGEIGVAAPAARELSPAAWTALAQTLLLRAGTRATTAFLAGTKRAAIDGRDALVTDAAVELGAAGVLTPETDVERTELALRKGETPRVLPELDERHELAARLLGDSQVNDARTQRLMLLLANEVGRDSLITYAVVEHARRTNALTPQLREALYRVPPRPLTMALRVELADSSSRESEQGKLRAIARTNAERSLAGM